VTFALLRLGILACYRGGTIIRNLQRPGARGQAAASVAAS
jgi:hypothetical protein